MREIKFRAWNSKAIIYSGDTDLRFYIEAKSGKPYSLERWSDDEWTMTILDWKIMQFTGLKDKNGIEIYEGDIVNKGYHNLDVFDEVNSVEMGQGSDSDGYSYGEWYGWKAGRNSLLDLIDKCEVIGNIYENPELLEKA